MRTIVLWCNSIFFINNKNLKEKVDSMGVLKLDVTFNGFAVLQLHVIRLYYVLMTSTFN